MRYRHFSSRKKTAVVNFVDVKNTSQELPSDTHGPLKLSLGKIPRLTGGSRSIVDK